MQWYMKSREEAIKLAKTDLKRGLTEEEAKRRLEKNGKNSFEDNEKRNGFLKRVLNQLNDFLVIVLIAASVVSFGVSFIKGDGEYADSLIIMVIVAVNAFLGVIQEDKAQKAIDELKKLTENKAKVIRNGKLKEIDAAEVVFGDIIFLEAGDVVCADGRIIECEGLMCEESSLTGESHPSEKDEKTILKENVAVGDRKNMVFSSTSVTSGRAKAVVVETGKETEVGAIAGLLGEGEEKTPLQERLDKTGKILGIGAIAVCGLIFLMGIMRSADVFDMFMTSVSLAVAAIPEGLVAIVTIVLAIGMQTMSKKNAVIRRLPVVETLGCADVICSDKTGTLTENKMRVVRVFGLSRDVKENRKNVLFCAAACSNATFDGRSFKGEPTEKALCEAAQECGGEFEKLRDNLKRIYEIPFSSDRKMMSTVHIDKDGRYVTSVKGAFDVLADKCDRVLIDEKEKPLTDRIKKEFYEENKNMALKALRVICTAQKITETKPEKAEAEKGLTLIGLAGLTDPPRKEARTAVSMCKRAGIKPVMITGDHILTAIAVAEGLGIYEEGDSYLTGSEIEKMTDDELKRRVTASSVFARVSPLHKLRIVEAYKANGSVVAMTGDGVNDAPALKAAHIGCAMGLNGTEVAKSAADMVIMDDNFATIVEAVKEGRGIYQNIKRAVHFLVSSNIGEIITIFAAMVFGWSVPLLPIQLLWVNLVTDALPAIALSFEKADDDIMERPPLKAEKSMFSGGVGLNIVLEGAMIGMISLIAFGVGHIYFDLAGELVVGRTMAFCVLSVSQLVHVFNIRSEKSIFKVGIKGNKVLSASFFVGVLLMAAVITIEPLRNVFGVTALTLEELVIVTALCLVPVLVVEIEKAVSKKEGC